MEELNGIGVGAGKSEGAVALAEAEAELAPPISDQPALASTTTASDAASPKSLFENPMNAAFPTLSSGKNDGVIKEENEIENADAPPSNDSNNLLLNFVGSFETKGEVTNHMDAREVNPTTNQESEFDLLGLPDPEQTILLPDISKAPVDSELNHLGIHVNSDEINQVVRANDVDDEIPPINEDSKYKSAGDKPEGSFDLDKADNIADKGSVEIGVMPHTPSSPGEISPVTESQPPTSIEINGQEEVLNLSPIRENIVTAGLVERSTDSTLVEAEVVDEKATDDRQANGAEDLPSQLTADDVIAPATLSSVSVISTHNSAQNFIENNERVKVGGSVAGVQVNTDAEERTEEEEEWLSMGLGLGDALRQIVALTEEKDSAIALCQEKDNSRIQAEALLAEVQSRLEVEMNRRAESDSEIRKLRETLKSYEDRLKSYETMEDDLEKANANLVSVVTEKSKIELEVQKLRDMVEESQQKEAVLSNRLNEAKKKEANKSTAAGRLEEENEKLQLDLQATKDELESVSKAKAKLESNMEKLKVKAVERVKQAETALSEERELNEERKKKMKTFVETKAEELREAKECASNMQKELEETRASLRSSRDREEASLKELEAARLKHRELQRDMERMVRNSEQLHKAGNSLEQELEKYASETEEHKKKRISAKHEIMQMVRTLEAERAVSAKLRESVKFTFTPKALSQQELLTECLRDFESELERLAAKTGKTLLPSSEPGGTAPGESTAGGAETSESNGQKSKQPRASKSDLDTDRLISNLEQETQHVSKGIMALAGEIERMRTLLNDDNAFGCLAYFSTILPRTGEARHQRLGDGRDAHEKNNSTDRFV